MGPEGIYDTPQERVSVEVRFTRDRAGSAPGRFPRGIARLLVVVEDLNRSGQYCVTPGMGKIEQ